MSLPAEDDKPDASQIYLLTGKNYRISRSIKASWFLDNFNKVIAPNTDDVINSSSEELEVLSVLPKPTSDQSDPCIVVPSTLITFLGRIYKFIFCLDVSQSLASVDILSGKVVNEISFESFENCMHGLVLPFSVPGSSLVLSPELHVTVLGYNGVMDCGTVQVLVEGCLVTQGNVELFLSSVYQQLQQMENKNAGVVKAVNNENNDVKQPFSHVTSELSIVAMLKMSILALELLPGTASGGIVIISDGVFGLPNAAMVHALLAQLRSHTVCCSFVKVGSPFQAQCSFGYIPNTDLMKFLANATSGVYMSKAPRVKERSCDSDVDEDLPPMNFYHKAFLCWSFQWEYDLSKISSWEDHQDMTNDVANKRSSIMSVHQWDKALTEPLIRKRHAEKILRTTISSVLSIRLREGYCIKDISFLRGGKELVVKLLLLWKQNAYIEYTAAATWPVQLSNAVTKIEIVVQGTYGFLHDVYSKQLYSMKGYRANVVETFNHTLKNLEMTDALLVSLQSFSSNQLYYSTPESVRRGVPLFYFPPNSPQPVLSLEHGKSKKSSKSQEAQFAVFWKTMLTLDVNTWQRWMHCHRINIVLEHDRPLPKSLFLPSPNDRFYHIQCRNSLSSLAAFLKQWSSFVLAENHTYIKFVQGDDPEEPPRSFCIVRISSKAPCIVIRIAFLGGTPGKERHEIVNSLRDDLKAIKAQFAPSGKLSKNSRKENEEGRQIQELLVCTTLHKPLDRILVRYDEQPKNFLVRPAHSQESSAIIETYKPWMHRAKGMPESPLKVLSRFLYHQRWVFTLHPKGLGSTATPNTISKILRHLTNVRENQGYRFVASNLGVTTMFKEFWVKETDEDVEPQTTCIVQFVMFPPLTSSSHNRVAGWALDNRLPEDERELELVVEVWVEPQHGIIVGDEIPEYLVGKRFFEIPAKIFEADIETISAWLSYDHICRMCDDRVVNSPDEAIVHIQSPTSDPDKKSTIYEVPFPFDVMKVLNRSRQAELWFSTLIENERPVSSRSTYHRCNDILFDYILEHMGRLHDRELTLTTEDSRRFLDFSLQRIGVGKPDQDKSIKWRCFTRTENGHLLVTFIPASFQALQDFAMVVKDLESRSVDASLESKASAMFRKRQASTSAKSLNIERRTSNDDNSSETVGKFWRSRRSSQRSCVDLSLFVYDFAISSLTDNDESLQDILLDHRNRLAQFEQNVSLEKSKELRSHCMAVYELFLYCFVSTVFESLRRGESVDDDNLDEVLAICSDHIPEEIDIFGFLGNVCGHIKHPTNVSSVCNESLEDWQRIHEENAINFLRTNHDVNSSEPLWASRCEELDGLHDFIQQRFDLVLQKYFSAIPNRRDHYFYRPYFLQDSYQSEHSDEDESDEENLDNNSEPDSDGVVFDESVLQYTNGSESENLKSTADTNTDDITEGSVPTTDLGESESEKSDYPSDQSDMQSSIKEENVMEQLEEEHNVPLFLSLNCTIRDKSHLSNTMVSMPAEYLPACFAEILDQASHDPEQIVDPSISSLKVTLDLICLVPPREPDYSRWKSRNRYRTRSSSVSSLSSDSPHEKMVRFENIAQKSVSVTASHDRESSLLVSGLPSTQIESIREIRDDINWLLQDEIVFSLCHVPFISKSILHSVTEHIIKSQKMEHIIKSQKVEASSSHFTSMKLEFVVDQEKSLSIFMEELDKICVGGYTLSKLDEYLYLRRSSLNQCTADQLKTEHEKSAMMEDQELEDEMFVCFGSLFSDEGDFPLENFEKSSRHQSRALDSFSEVWLILRKSESSVLDVLFHARDDKYYFDLYTNAIDEINALCHLVNQKMLLRYVYDNKICHPLLQPRSDADIWNERFPYSTPAHTVLAGVDGSQVVLQEYRYQAGYFKCPVKWTADLPIHFRLKGNSNRNSGADRAQKALQTVLEMFSLNEKSSMYVYQERNGNIFYFNLDSSLCLSNEAEIEATKDNLEVDENNQSPAVSPVSSFQSCSKTVGTAELEDELDEFPRKTSAGLNTDKDTISMNDSMNFLPAISHVQECIKLTVHGVTEPSDEIKKDLVVVFQNRLDECTLEMLTIALARNPNTKLASQDVQFIQPSGSAPSLFIRLVLPSFAAKNLHPFAFFFKQHLLNYLHTPKYATQTENDHFKKFTQANEDCSQPLPENDVFIFFTKTFNKGKKGELAVACISVSMVDSRGNALQITPEQKEIGHLNEEMKSDMEKITTVVTAESLHPLSDDAIVVEISVWKRGDAKSDVMIQLEQQLKMSVRHALCDVVMEYYALTASFSCIPDQYLKLSSKNGNYKSPHKPSTFLATHRRTPSAGLLGCGRADSPIPQPPRTYRSLSSSPVWHKPPTSGVCKVKTPEILTTPPTFESSDKKCSQSVSEQTDRDDESKTKERPVLSIPSDKESKHRSHSEGGVMNKSSTHFRPIGRSFSNPTPPRMEVQKRGGEPDPGRFSPYETFTENELTESKEFGEEAVKANVRYTASKTSRTKSTGSDSAEIKEREVEEERKKYENGDKGKLHPSFQGLVQELMQFAKSLDSPSMLVQKETLLTRYSVDAVLYELINMVKNLCPDLNSKIYRAVPSSPQSSCDPCKPPTIQYVLYDPIRPPLQASNDEETAVDVSGSYMATSTRPAASFVLISRNILQWRDNGQKLQDPFHVQSDKDFSSQQFQSWKWNRNDEASERSRSAAFSNCAPGFVSRQRLILIDIKDKEILATTYNLSSEINTRFSDRLARLVNWNNARCHLVSCLFQQKMGLFHHSTFQGLNTKSKEVTDMNPFCESVNDHDLFSLLKQTAPSSPEQKNSSGQKQIPSVAKLLFEETLRDVVAPRPLQTTKHCTYRDPVKRHGAQFQEIRAIQIRKAVHKAELQKLFTSWLRRGGINHSTGDHSINLLKRQSRLVHCCKTPFLVCDEWISSVEGKANVNQQLKQNNQDTNEPVKAVKENNWHYKLREEFLNYYTQFLQSQQFALVQLTTQSTKVQRKPPKPTRKKAVSDRPKHISEVGNETEEKQLHHYLQKTIDGSEDDETYAYDGGIMLVELGYEGCHFSVKLYAFESSRLLSSENLNQQVQANFLAECAKVRDLTHLNSFSYDFHLRHVQYFLSRQRLVFPKGFRLTSMLGNLMNVYIYPPKFSWNHLCKGQLSLPLLRLSREIVFNYIVEHCARYNLSAVEMDSKDGQHENVLVSTSCQDQYEFSLVAKLNLDADEGQLGLKFYIVKSNRQQLFPKMKPEISRRKQSSGFVGDTGIRFRQPGPSPEREPVFSNLSPGMENIKRASSSPLFITALPLSQSPSEELLRHLPHSRDSPNSSNSQKSFSSQKSLSSDRPYIIAGLEADPSDTLMAWDLRNLGQDADKFYHKLLAIVSSAQKDCLRDHLWYLLLKGASTEESGNESQAWKPKGRRKTEYRRNDFTDTWLVPSSLRDAADSINLMTFEDFECLLKLVKPLSLPVVDEMLKPFLSMNTAWYFNLWTTLLSKFGESSREFSKNDSKVYYFVLLNSNNLDMFMLIHINEEKRRSDVKIVNRIAAEESKKSDRAIAKSCDDFITDVVNVFCYQMWTGLLL